MYKTVKLPKSPQGSTHVIFVHAHNEKHKVLSQDNECSSSSLIQKLIYHGSRLRQQVQAIGNYTEVAIPVA